MVGIREYNWSHLSGRHQSGSRSKRDNGSWQSQCIELVVGIVVVHHHHKTAIEEAKEQDAKHCGRHD